MKFLHLSDLHIGKRVLDHSMLEDQQYILRKITDICTKVSPDAVIIAGDVYDRPVPSIDAVMLFDDFLTKLSEICENIFIIGGNHDSGERLSFASNLISTRGIHIRSIGKAEITPVRLCDKYGPVDFYLIPFTKPAYVKHYYPEKEINDYNDALKILLDGITIDASARNVAVAHQFVKGGEPSDSEEHFTLGGMDEVDVSLFDMFDYTALGHLHRPQSIGSDRIRYSGSPLKYSASEVGHTKSVTVCELFEKGNMKLSNIPLEPLRDMRKLRGSYLELMEKTGYANTNTDDYVFITLTDSSEIPNALGKLRSVYPNIMNLKYDSLRFEIHDNEFIRADEVSDPLVLFESLYKMQNNVPMTDEQKQIMREIFDESDKEGGCFK